MNTRRSWTFLIAPVLLAALALLPGCQSDVTDNDVTDNEISLMQVHKLWTDRAEGDAAFVDVRQPKEFARKHIPGAVNKPWTELTGKKNDQDPRLARFKTIVIYGQNRAPGPVFAAGKRMTTSGYKFEAFLGGLDEWTAAGMPVEGEGMKR